MLSLPEAEQFVQFVNTVQLARIVCNNGLTRKLREHVHVHL